MTEFKTICIAGASGLVGANLTKAALERGYRVRGESNALFEMLDADLNVTATLHTADFKAVWDAQQQA